MQSTVQRIAELNRNPGNSDQFLGRLYDEPHRRTIAMQDEAFDWLDKKLNHRHASSLYLK